MKYYLLSWNSKKAKGPVAYVEEESRPSFQVARDVFDKDKLPFVFKIRHVTETKTGLLKSDHFVNNDEIWPDYLPNQFAWPLFSEKAKNILQQSFTERDTIKWVCADIVFNDIVKTYYVLQFENKLDTLNFEKTMFVSGTDAIIKPVFSQSKIRDLSVIHRPASNDLWKITSSICVSERIRDALTKEKCTNMEFSQVKVE